MSNNQPTWIETIRNTPNDDLVTLAVGAAAVTIGLTLGLIALAVQAITKPR